MYAALHSRDSLSSPVQVTHSAELTISPLLLGGEISGLLLR